MTTAEGARASREGEGEQIEDKWITSRFFLVGNIPAKFRSADLRAVFSQFVEKGYFVCFHYRHRPEQLHRSQEEHGASTSNTKPETTAAIVIPTDTHTLGSDESSTHSQSQSHEVQTVAEGVAKTKCCVVSVTDSGRRDGGAGKFVQMYANKNWSLADGGMLRQTVRISELRVDFEEASHQQNAPTNLGR